MYKGNENYFLEEETRPGQFLPIDEDEHGTYIMNSKDLCSIEYLKELKDAGVCSFKVEGRNKTIYYVATVARAYRKAIDAMEAGKPFDKNLIVELAKTSNRGFIPGFLTNDPRERAQDYEKTLTHQTHEFVGVIRGVVKKGTPPTAGRKKELYEMEVKGRLDAPVKCDVMTPKKDFSCTLKKFIDPNGKELKTVHPGQKDRVLIELPKKVCVGAILRKEKESHQQQ